MASENRMQKWLEIVDRDIDAAEWMQQGGRWLYVAFECHQALEKVIKAYWCGDVACEDTIKADTTCTSRCMPFGEQGEVEGNRCICCGKPAKALVYWGKAY